MIPQHIFNDLEAYRNGKHPYPFGSFVTALLANDLVEAARRADNINRHLWREYADYLCTLPRTKWGSYEIVEQEIARQYTEQYVNTLHKMASGEDDGN